MFRTFLKLCVDNFTLGEKVQLIQLLELKMILYFQISIFCVVKRVEKKVMNILRP